MYAIIEDSGCQFKVEEGQELTIDLRREEVPPGGEVRFERVLAVRDDGGGERADARDRVSRGS